MTQFKKKTKNIGIIWFNGHYFCTTCQQNALRLDKIQ